MTGILLEYSISIESKRGEVLAFGNRKSVRDKRRATTVEDLRSAQTWRGKWYRLRVKIAHSKTYIRTIELATVGLLLLFGSLGGIYRNAHMQHVRAMTVSTSGSLLKFSKTGSAITLQKQYRYKNMTVIPLKFESTDAVTLNADRYQIFFKNVANNDGLPPLKCSFVLFGTTGTGAIVVAGDLPKQPLQVVVRDDLPLKSVTVTEDTGNQSENGTGKINFDGKSVPVKYDGIGFKINPKGSDVRVDDRIKTDMKLSTLYSVVAGDKAVAAAQKKIDGYNTAQQANIKQEKEYYSQLAQINSVLHRASDDVSQDTDTTNTTNSTLAENRNALITKIQACDGATEDYYRQLEDAKSELKQTKSLISSMNNYATMSSRYGILD